MFVALGCGALFIGLAVVILSIGVIASAISESPKRLSKAKPSSAEGARPTEKHDPAPESRPPVPKQVRSQAKPVSADRKAPDPASAIVKITKEASPPYKASLNIQLSRPVSEPEIRQLANQLKKQDGGEHERLFIMYFLPGMDTNATAWATTHFTPELSVQILGQTATQSDALLGRAGYDDKHVIGQWIDDQSVMLRQIHRLRRVSTKFTLVSILADGKLEKDVVPLLMDDAGLIAIVSQSDLEAFKTNVRDTEFYVVNKSGELQLMAIGETLLTRIAQPIDANGKSSTSHLDLPKAIDFYQSRYREPRVWTSSDNKFSVKARYLSKVRGQVKLRKDDASEIQVDISRLSSIDRDYIANAD